MKKKFLQISPGPGDFRGVPKLWDGVNCSKMVLFPRAISTIHSHCLFSVTRIQPTANFPHDATLLQLMEKNTCLHSIKCFGEVSLDYIHSFTLFHIDANRSQKLGLNDANRGRKSLKWCKFRLEITKNRAQMMQIGPNCAAMSA